MKLIKFTIIAWMLFGGTTYAQSFLDTTFNHTGIIKNDSGICYKIKIQPDKKILNIGYVDKANGQRSYMFRFHEDGTRDLSFSNQWYFNELGSLTGIIILPNNKLLMCGQIQTSNSQSATDFLLFKTHPNGVIDQSFGNNGSVITDLARFQYGVWLHGTQDYATSLALQDSIRDMVLAPDNKILVIGTCDDDFVIYRVNSNGTLDNTFGNGGIIITNVEDGEEDKAETIALQEDGKILVGGSSEFRNDPNKTPRFVIARYLADGYTGIEQIPSKKSIFTLYPNPANDEINISWKELDVQAQVDIIDVYGRILITLKNQRLDMVSLSINISTLNSGIYFVNVRAANGLNEQQKFIRK